MFSGGLPTVNECGFVPLLYDFNGKEILIIVNGGIRGHMFPVVYGIPYLYSDFVWPDMKTPTEEECLKIAKSERLNVDKTLREKIDTMLSSD